MLYEKKKKHKNPRRGSDRFTETVLSKATEI